MSAQIDQFVHKLLPSVEDLPVYIYSGKNLHKRKVLNLVTELFNQVEEKGYLESPFLRSSMRSITYSQARSYVSQISQFLTQELNLIPGNRVLLRGGNSISMALNWLAVVNAGMVAVSTMPLLRAKELGEIIDKAQPAVALCDENLMDELIIALEMRPIPSKIISFDAQHLNGEIVSRSSKFVPNSWFCATTPQDIALLAFTSGTTGVPKAAVHTHLDILGSCEGWPNYVLRAQASDIVMGSPPLAFTFGLGGLLIFPMYAACSVYYPDVPYRPESMIEMMKKVAIQPLPFIGRWRLL
jgi:2-aminobenzoate-CoA ligase